MSKKINDKLKILAQMSDDTIDYSDIPDQSNKTDWVRLHPKKKDIHATIDEDVLKWAKKQSTSLSGFINKVLREKMLKATLRATK